MEKENIDKGNPLPNTLFIDFFREAKKKSSFTNGQAIKALPPRSLIATRTFYLCFSIIFF